MFSNDVRIHIFSISFVKVDLQIVKKITNLIQYKREILSCYMCF
jgi:hypothetical protein